jgi:inositol 1,4,5-triphosphate receptor type 1
LTAKHRGIAIPVDLDSQVNQMFEKSNNVMNKAKVWINSKLHKRESIASVSRDYRNIIEGLQVQSIVFLYVTVGIFL